MVRYHLDTIIESLDHEACRQLLAANTIGRVAFMDDPYPLILPVNYVLFDGFIVFRTDPGAKLSRLPLRPAAFEIDGREGTTSAWSVVVQGHAREVTTALGDTYETLRSVNIDLLSPGEKAHWIAIEIEQVSGRRLALQG